jgi:threonyl-tRNA synthetase
LGKRIRYSEREWVPYVIVCGDKELGNSCFPIRVRGEDQKEMSLSVLTELIKEKTKGMPFRSLQGLLLSKRPVFRGRD